jgi:hypothetical protein
MSVVGSKADLPERIEFGPLLPTCNVAGSKPLKKKPPGGGFNSIALLADHPLNIGFDLRR